MTSFQYNNHVMLLLILSIIVGYVTDEIQASNHVYNLQHTTFSLNGPSYQRYRTSYHFQPIRNFINGVSIGDPFWGHSTSTDLVNWTAQPIAIRPKMVSNMNGSLTGSTTILLPQSYTPAILFTGITPQNEQVQNLVFPKNLSDPYLKEWVQLTQNPVISSPTQIQINATSFRGPSTVWMPPDGRWRAIIGSKRDRRGLALLYRSKDFIKWDLADHPLYSYQNTGMWESPDFYHVHVDGSTIGADTSTFGPVVKHVLKVSLTYEHDVYMIGTYNTTTDTYVPNEGFENISSTRYDYGKYYASKTFFDSRTQRRILFGWVNESSIGSDDIKKGWSGIHGVPRSIWLDIFGKQLIQWPIVEIESLRENRISLPTQVLEGGSLIKISGVTASQADVQVSFKIDNYKSIENFDRSWTDPQILCSQKGPSMNGRLGPFGLLTLASKGLEEQTSVFFRVFKDQRDYVVLMCSDQSKSSLSPSPDKTTYGTFVDVDPTQDGLSLRILINHSVIESFGCWGKNVITARVYPTIALDDNAHLYVFNNGTRSVEITSLNAWSMTKASIA